MSCGCDTSLFLFSQKKYRKGSIDVSKIKCVEIVKNDDGVIPCPNKYPFQVSWQSYSRLVPASVLFPFDITGFCPGFGG